MKASNKKIKNRLNRKDIVRLKAEIMFHYRGSISYSELKKMPLEEALSLYRELDRLLAQERLAAWMIAVYPMMAGAKNEQYEQALWEMIDPKQRSSDLRSKNDESIKMRDEIMRKNKEMKFKEADQALKSLFGIKK